MSEPILYQYKPREGAFITGVPQRDLTAKDVQHAGPAAMRDAVASGLYKKTAAADKKPSKAELPVEPTYGEPLPPEEQPDMTGDAPADEDGAK